MKLTLDALKERADVVASEELLATISGGTENACHDDYGVLTPLVQAELAEAEAANTAAQTIWNWLFE